MRSSFSKNTAELNLRQSINKKKEIIASYSDASEEAAKLEKEILEIDESLSHVSGSLATLDTQNETSQKEIDELTKQLEEAKQKESSHTVKYAGNQYPVFGNSTEGYLYQ